MKIKTNTKIKSEQIGAVVDYMNDHYRYFECFPLDIEINGVLYDLSPVIKAIHQLKGVELKDVKWVYRKINKERDVWYQYLLETTTTSTQIMAAL